jgi:hypothetical protein
MRDRCPVAQAGQVFLALVGWRPSPGCTGSASPCACLTSWLESLKLEKPFQGSNLGYFQPTVPASERQGAAQHWDLHKQAPRLSALGSLTRIIDDSKATAPTAGVQLEAQRLYLCVRSGRFQDDGKRESSQNRRSTPAEQETRPRRGAGHERPAITIQDKHA